jgi:hypothetical protein
MIICGKEVAKKVFLAILISAIVVALVIIIVPTAVVLSRKGKSQI